jgi:hypothetical protein
VRFSLKKMIVGFLVLVMFGLPFMYFFIERVDYWFFTAILVLTMICWLFVAVKQRDATARFGTQMTFEEIIEENDPIRMVQLLRYHLGWSPQKIAAELNRLKIHNHGMPWRVYDVEATVAGIVGRLF